jgi:hypothetical protein
MKVKRQPTKWEEIFANHISDKVLTSTTQKELKIHNKKITQF